ncbi:hypothetical protein [Methanolobus chelungpuianus]|uniref:Uncharacterized protein n=1 Tax=Methanolobus chelungpuianus TaxID=502115 RepID=A0AAE3H972_9EURY|nr:hypothetical protein [Methanolobus chelungpuianus]MCQ6962265.1 hypothetical protein [Methanolobus chelungpuianus]
MKNANEREHMRKMGIKLFTYLAIVLMVASILSTGALAASDNAQKAGLQIKDRDRDMINANGNALRKQAEGLNNTTQDLNNTTLMNRAKGNNNVKAGYLDARDNFVKMKNNDKNLDSEEAIEATKDYLNSTIDYMIVSLEDEEYITQLELIKEDVAAADTRKELAECARDIRDIWKDANRQKTASASKSADNKLSAVIRTSENMALRLENEIARLEGNGENVAELRSMLEEYRSLIAEAKVYQLQAANATDADEKAELIRNMNMAGQKIKEANALLKDMLKGLRQHREGLVVLTGNNTLTAEGNGTAVLSGNLTLEFNATDAKLVVKDMAGDAVINTGNASYALSNIDAGNSESNNRAFVFHNLTGTVTIEGSRLTVMIRSEDMSLSVDGEGTAVLSGDGSYELESITKEWAKYDDENDEEEESDEGSEESDMDEDDENPENESVNSSFNNTSEGNSSVSGNLTGI